MAEMLSSPTMHGVDVVNFDQLTTVTGDSSDKEDAAKIFGTITEMKDTLKDKIKIPITVGKTYMDQKNNSLPLSDQRSWCLPSHSNKSLKEKYCVRVVAAIYERADHDDYACLLCEKLQRMFNDTNDNIIVVQTPRHSKDHVASCIFIKFTPQDTDNDLPIMLLATDETDSELKKTEGTPRNGHPILSPSRSTSQEQHIELSDSLIDHQDSVCSADGSVKATGDELMEWGLGKSIDITRSCPFDEPKNSIVKITGSNCTYIAGRGMKSELGVFYYQRSSSMKFEAEVSEFVEKYTDFKAGVAAEYESKQEAESLFSRRINETRRYNSNPSPGQQFEKDICAWIVEKLKLKKKVKSDDAKAIIRKAKINLSDRSNLQKIVQYFEETCVTHFISSIQLGACEEIQEDFEKKKKKGSMKAKMESSHFGGGGASISKGRESSTKTSKVLAKGNVELVEVGGKGEKKEYVINQDACALSELISSDLPELKKALEAAIDIYCKRKNKVYFYIKCEGRNAAGKQHDLYLQVNSQNQLIAVENREDASDFEILPEKTKFAIKHGSDYLVMPDEQEQDGPLKFRSGKHIHFSLEHDSKKVVTTIDTLKTCDEQKYYFVYKKEKYLNLHLKESQMVTTLKKKPKQRSGEDYYFFFKLEN